ncbi:hypothetical protein NKDENANG_02003 [Candidatus Entotheonellaceae bacterium PAL068K]
MAPVLAYTILLVLASLLLLKGFAWLVDSAARPGRTLRLSELTVGVTIVAFGASFPEFAVTLGAALLGKSNISIGNIVGLNIFNLGFIRGGCAAIKSLLTATTLVYRGGLWLVGMACVLRLMLPVMLHDRHLSRLEG